jgi:hypothetical protein
MNSNNEQVWVRLKKDPSRVREMTARAFEINSDKWELLPNPQSEEDRSQLAIQAAQKKRAASAAVETETIVEATEEHKTDFVDITEQSIEENLTGNEDLENLTVLGLREQYEIKSGKPADKRWKESRIKAEIEKLTQI